MATREISDDVRSLALRRLESPAFLDVLLLLRAGGARAWSPAEVVTALHLDEVEVSRALVTLRQAGILKAAIGEDVSYSFAPHPEVADTIAELARAYREQPQAILDLIATRPRHKLRLFADAFRLRSDE
jgi:hypothetical protein